MSSVAETLDRSLAPAKSSFASPGLVETGKDCVQTLLNYFTITLYEHMFSYLPLLCSKRKKQDLQWAHGPCGMEVCACDICVFRATNVAVCIIF